jgi:hypothetical protein
VKQMNLAEMVLRMFFLQNKCIKFFKMGTDCPSPFFGGRFFKKIGDISSRGTVRPGDCSSRGRFIQGTVHPGDGSSRGRFVQGVFCHVGESLQKLRGQTLWIPVVRVPPREYFFMSILSLR